ncbi:class I SAM-dependent methyltransferase [Luteolibacter sp. Populi]|uniref:class I SAM-dependent methyltransferase n=1 Tax=Luteolibacter sp. Populi TaxID=3230487 RepID=UPI003466F7D6
MKTRSLPLIEKNPWIANRVRGANVLHVGCTDWPLTGDRLERGELLHSELCKVTARCVGVDLDSEGIAKLRELMPAHEFHVENAETLGEASSFVGTQWDFIVAGDVVEHMNNPGLFFDSVRKLLTPDGTLIVTVPSAFSAKRFFWLLFTGQEQVHPDHTGYFSESTLIRIGERNGYKVSAIYGFQWLNPTLKNRIANMMSAPFVWFSRGRCADEVAVEFRKSA